MSKWCSRLAQQLIVGVTMVSGMTMMGAMSAHAAAPVDFSGVWRVVKPIQELRTVDGKEPPLLPEAKQLYDQRRALLRKGDRSFDLATTQCKPLGEPRIMYESRDYPFEILQTDKQLFFGYSWNRLIRYIYIDRPQKVLIPLYFGGSGGKWQGDTLVAEVNGLHESVTLDAAGMPHSEDIVMTERYSLVKGGKQMQVRITFNDPATFSKPWDALVTFEKLTNTEIAEDVCVERINLFGGK